MAFSIPRDAITARYMMALCLLAHCSICE